jgi:nitrogen fixation protein FixH
MRASTVSPRRSGRPLTGRMVLIILLAFFGTVIGVNVTMMKLAIATLPGTEVDSAYSASIGYEFWPRRTRRRATGGSMPISYRIAMAAPR